VNTFTRSANGKEVVGWGAGNRTWIMRMSNDAISPKTAQELCLHVKSNWTRKRWRRKWSIIEKKESKTSSNQQAKIINNWKVFDRPLPAWSERKSGSCETLFKIDSTIWTVNALFVWRCSENEMIEKRMGDGFCTRNLLVERGRLPDCLKVNSIWFGSFD
jgi:hypothetical protein